MRGLKLFLLPALAWAASPLAGALSCPPSPLFTVDTTADGVDADPTDCLCATTGGKCTLRAAIMQANQTTGATIVVPARSNANPYALTIPPSGADAADTGDLNIFRSLTIAGGGAAGTLVDGGMLDGIFNVHGNSIVVSIS